MRLRKKLLLVFLIVIHRTSISYSTKANELSHKKDNERNSTGLQKNNEGTIRLESYTNTVSEREETTKELSFLNDTRVLDMLPYNKNCFTSNDFALPMCSFCKERDMSTVTVYFEEFGTLNSMYGNTYSTREVSVPKTCLLPNNAKCIPQHTDKMADVVFRMQWFMKNNYPVRYCYPQIISILNSEVEGLGYENRPQVAHAEVHIDFHWYRDALRKRAQPDPSERMGVAMFFSHCKEGEWRTEWIKKLIPHIHIDMHGTCFHNVEEGSDRFSNDFTFSFIKKASKYRAIITLENNIQKAYVSEKIFAVYASGAVPVYWGPPDVHQWLPGNHTYVDLSKYKYSQKSAAEYIKRILEDDEVFKYHTSNFDVDKVFKFTERVCSFGDYVCNLCKHAYKLKEASYTRERTCNCYNQPTE